MASLGVFARNVMAVASVRVIGLVSGLALSVMIARILGPEDRGIYALAVLLPSLIVAFANFGIGPALVYHVAQRRHSRQVILGNSTILSLVIGTGAVIAGLIFVFLWRETMLPGVPERFLFLALALVPLGLLTSNLRQIFLGLERFRDLSLVAIVQAIVSLLLFGLVLWGFRAGVPGAIGVRVGTSLLSAIGFFLWARHLCRGISWRPDRPYLKAATNFGVKAHLANIIQFLNYRLDIYLVNGFLNPISVGFYSIAVGVAERIWLVSHAASVALYPRVAAETDEKARDAFTPVVSRNVLWISVVGAGVLYGLSHWIITILYSNDYLPAARPLQVLLPGVVALSASRVLANDLAGRGRPILNSYVSGVGLIVNIGLNLILIPRYGIEGAALATTASYVAMWGLTLLLYSAISKNSPWKVTVPRRSDWELWREMAYMVVRWVKGKAGSPGEAALP